MIQLRHQADPAMIAKQMVLDMKVRWSSTYAMLDRGYTLREVLIFLLFLSCNHKLTRGLGCGQVCFRDCDGREWRKA
jgi:hypothetical protein